MTNEKFTETENPPLKHCRKNFTLMIGNEPLTVANEINARIPNYEPSFPRGEFHNG